MLNGIDIPTAASCLAELGNPHRLAAFRLLVKAGPDGLAVGAIQQHLGIPKSTLSHHLAHLAWAGLIEQRRHGRCVVCTANYERANAILRFLCEECCAGVTLVEEMQAAG